MPNVISLSSPKYAAGGEMDSIRTGREIRPRGKRSGPFLILLLVVIIARVVVPQLCGTESFTDFISSFQPTYTLQTPVIGEIEFQLTETTFDNVLNIVTVGFEIVNNTNKAISQSIIQFTITDSTGATLGNKSVKVFNLISPSETLSRYESIPLETVPMLCYTVLSKMSYKTMY